jgi:hypothetical protein
VARNIWPRSRSGRIATVVVIALLALPALWLLGAKSLIAGWLEDLWALLAGSTLVPNWALALLILCALIVAGLFGAALAPRKESADPEPEERPSSSSAMHLAEQRWGHAKTPLESLAEARRRRQADPPGDGLER